MTSKRTSMTLLQRKSKRRRDAKKVTEIYTTSSIELTHPKRRKGKEADMISTRIHSATTPQDASQSEVTSTGSLSNRWRCTTELARAQYGLLSWWFEELEDIRTYTWNEGAQWGTVRQGLCGRRGGSRKKERDGKEVRKEGAPSSMTINKYQELLSRATT